jgi:hypothetical protein
MDKKSPKRHTHSSIAAYEDAIAILWEIIRVLAVALKVASQKARRVIEIMKVARKGPHAYDPDQPSNTKVTIKKR